jgi:Domain of unknown function (DUF5919)
MRRRPARLATFFRSRTRQLVWAGLLALLGVALLVGAYATADFTRDVLINLGASVVMVGLTFVVFDPIFEDMRRNAVQEHRALNHDQLVADIAAARGAVDVMETWTGLLEDRYRDRFLAGMGAALDRGVHFRLLLLNPESQAAEQRADELHLPVPHLIMENLRHLSALRARLEPRLAALLHVRIYDASPSIQLYHWDDMALISFFPVGVRAYDAPQIEAYMDSPLGQFVNGRFEELWESPTSVPLDDFMALPLTITLGRDGLASSDVRYVRIGEQCYVYSLHLLGHVADHGIGHIGVQTQRPVTIGGWTGYQFTLERLTGHDEPSLVEVAGQLDRKYGGRHGGVILRLVPQLGGAP